MDDREWMYTGRVTRASMTNEWIEKTNEFLEGHGHKLKGRDSCGVPAIVVETRNERQRRSWANILSIMDLRQTIPGGSFTVKPIV